MSFQEGNGRVQRSKENSVDVEFLSDRRGNKSRAKFMSFPSPPPRSLCRLMVFSFLLETQTPRTVRLKLVSRLFGVVSRVIPVEIKQTNIFAVNVQKAEHYLFLRNGLG
jgi:hypothetical protein